MLHCTLRCPKWVKCIEESGGFGLDWAFANWKLVEVGGSLTTAMSFDITEAEENEIEHYSAVWEDSDYGASPFMVDDRINLRGEKETYKRCVTIDSWDAVFWLYDCLESLVEGGEPARVQKSLIRKIKDESFETFRERFGGK